MSDQIILEEEIARAVVDQKNHLYWLIVSKKSGEWEAYLEDMEYLKTPEWTARENGLTAKEAFERLLKTAKKERGIIIQRFEWKNSAGDD